LLQAENGVSADRPPVTRPQSHWARAVLTTLLLILVLMIGIHNRVSEWSDLRDRRFSAQALPREGHVSSQVPVPSDSDERRLPPNTSVISGLIRYGQTRLHDLITPNSGEWVLPFSVRDMLTLLRRYDIQEYALSHQILADEEVKQHIVESAFPRRMLPSAAYLLALVEEQLPSNCRPLATKDGVQIAACS
jgi:hypothetical protein